MANSFQPNTKTQKIKLSSQIKKIRSHFLYFFLSFISFHFISFIILFNPSFPQNLIITIFKYFMLSHICKYSASALSNNSRILRTNLFYGDNGEYSSDTIHYTYNLFLHPGQKYNGVAQLAFKLKKKADLFIDFQGKEVRDLIVNGNQIEVGREQSAQFKSGRINLSQSLLKQGDNHVSVSYQNEYDRDGSGCVSFTDVDGKQYLYTQFQPYMGNRVFPMFDQPDLKAKMNLTISCPKEWETVLSNQFPTNSPSPSPVCALTKQVLQRYQNAHQSYRTISFQETKLLPTYLYCMVVGPYKRYVCKNTYKNIPMDLYCIESLYPYMLKQAPFIEEMTNKSMQFFEKYFGYPYPFSKYDQVFAHEYKWGAMENAGIVTLNDLYIFKDPVSTQKMLGFGNTIVHELAHHWFGNLVTMAWWDDLWLNQSFAEYISHFCLEKIKPEIKTLNYESAMASFLSRKSWGYSEDQLITTHSIKSEVADTHVAESIFDGITYSKGAATMKQLMYLMGEQQFSKSLASYFHKFAFRNAKLEDLLVELDKNFKHANQQITIQSWKKSWLEKPGLNVLSHQFCQETSTLKISQTAYHSNHATLRPHTIKIALIGSNMQIFCMEAFVRPQPITEVSLTKEQADKFMKSKAVILNHEDLSFVKVILDSQSQQFLNQNLKNIKGNTLLRSLIWKNFYEMIKDASMKISDYSKIIFNNLFTEESDVLLEENLSYFQVVINKFVPAGSEKDQALNALFQKILSELRRIEKGEEKNRVVILREKLISFSNMENQNNVSVLRNWIENTESCQMEKPNITESWKIVIKLLESKFLKKEEKESIVEKMVELDQSDTMKNKVLTCHSLLLPQNQLENHFQQYLTSDKWTMTTYIHSLLGFNHRIHQKSIQSVFRGKYFSVLQEVLGKNKEYRAINNSEMTEIFMNYMDPVCEDTLQDLQLKKTEFEKIKVRNNEKLRVEILKKIDSLQKRIKCYSLYK